MDSRSISAEAGHLALCSSLGAIEFTASSEDCVLQTELNLALTAVNNVTAIKFSSAKSR